jgi:hypothetical protein
VADFLCDPFGVGSDVIVDVSLDDGELDSEARKPLDAGRRMLLPTPLILPQNEKS